MLRVYFLVAVLFGLMIWVSGSGPLGTFISPVFAENPAVLQPLEVVKTARSRPTQPAVQITEPAISKVKFPFVIAKMQPVTPATTATAPLANEQRFQASFTSTSFLGTHPQVATQPAKLSSGLSVNPAQPAAFRTDPVLWVTGSHVNLRRSASSTSDIITALPRGTETRLIDVAQNGWLRIRDQRTGVTGYMYQEFLSNQPVDNS